MPFSLRRLSKFQWLALVSITALTVGGFAIGNKGWMTGKRVNADKISASPAIAATPAKVEYVRQGRLWPQLRKAFQTLGDRLEKPGKERVTLIGTLSRASKATKDEVVRLVLESADKMRLEEKDGVTIISNNDLKASKGKLKQEEQEEAESLLYDSADNFFAGQMQGQALRFLGSGFQSSTVAYDIYQVYERIVVGKEIRQRTKFHSFNSASQLLEQVRYETERNGKPIKIEVKFSQWQKVNGQQLPGVITRSENGIPVMTFTLTNATLSAKSDDGLFSRF